MAFVKYKQTLSKILLSSLTLYAEEIIGYHQSGFRCNKTITNRIFCIRQIHEKKLEYNEVVISASAINRLQKTYDSV